MVVNWCVAHKKTDWRTAHKVLFACFLQLCSTRRWISCSARNRAHVLYTKVNSRVAREFGLSHSTKIQKHTCVATRECQLRCERYHTYIATGNISLESPTYYLKHCCECVRITQHKGAWGMSKDKYIMR